MSSAAKLKIVICGPPGSGKDSLLHALAIPRFQTDYKLTVGVDILFKDVKLSNNQMATLSIWDIGGQERFSFIRSTFYKGASGAILVFDLSRAVTWDDIKNWYAEIKRFAGDIPFVLIGNKLDLIQDVGEVIDRDECREYAERQGSIYVEASEKNIIAVEDAIIELTEKIVNPTEFERLKIEEIRRKKEEADLEIIKKVLQVSSKIQINMLRNILDLDEKTFDSRIIEWAHELNFRIDGDYIVVENTDIDGFIKILDEQFEQWSKIEKK